MSWSSLLHGAGNVAYGKLFFNFVRLVREIFFGSSGQKRTYVPFDACFLPVSCFSSSQLSTDMDMDMDMKPDCLT